MGSSLMKFPVASSQYRPRLLQLACLGTTGSVEVQRVTAVAFASTAQADYFVLTNQAGEKIAVWLDKNAAGTAPTGAAYLAADYQVEVDIVTGDNTAAAVAAKIAAALGASYQTFTVTDNANGTIDFTSTVDGNIAAPARHNANDSGNGSFSVSTVTAGVDSLVDISMGFNHASIAEGAGLGDYTITFNIPFAQAPQVGVGLKSAGYAQIVSCSASAVQIKVFDVSSAAMDSDFDLIVLGSMSADSISNH